MALAILKIKLDEKITLYELHEAGCLQMPSLSAAQSMIIIVGLKEKFRFKVFLLWWEHSLTSLPSFFLSSFPPLK